jgi:hypothetical protein
MKNGFLKNSVGSPLASLIVIGLFSGLSALADVTLIDQNFDSPFTPNQSFAYGYFGGDITYSAYSVVPGAGTNGSSAMQITNSAAALGNGYGYGAAVYQEMGVTGNTNTALSAYTLSFDAKCSVANGNNVEVRVISQGGPNGQGTLDTAPTPPGYGNDRTLSTTYTHFSMNLGDTSVFQGNNNNPGFDPTSPEFQFLFQCNGGGGGNPPAWTVDIDNIVLTVTGTVPPPPPVTIYAPAKVPAGLNLYAGTMLNAYYDRQEVATLQSTGLGWVGRATASNPVSYSFTVNSAPTNTLQGSFQMYLVPNYPPSSPSAGSPDWFAPAMVETFLVGNSTNAVFKFAYKVNEAAGNAMLLGNAPYVNPPGSWDGVTTPYYESGVLGSITNNASILGTWTVKFTSSTNVTLIAPNGTNASYIIPPYNTQYLAENTSFNIYLSMQAQDQGAMNQSFNYGNFAVTGVLNPFSDNFLTDTTLNTSIWTNGLAISPANVFVSHGNQQLVTWSKPAAGHILQAAGQIKGVWTDLTQGPQPILSGLFAQVVSTNELPAGNSVFFRTAKLVPTQLQVLMPGQTNAPNTVSGYTGTATPISVSGQGLTPTTVRVNLCDANWNIVGGTDSVTISTSDGSALVPNSPLSMVNGTAIFSNPNGILFQTYPSSNTTVTAHDNTNAGVTDGTSAPFTVTN